MTENALLKKGASRCINRLPPGQYSFRLRFAFLRAFGAKTGARQSGRFLAFRRAEKRGMENRKAYVETCDSGQKRRRKRRLKNLGVDKFGKTCYNNLRCVQHAQKLPLPSVQKDEAISPSNHKLSRKQPFSAAIKKAR